MVASFSSYSSSILSRGEILRLLNQLILRLDIIFKISCQVLLLKFRITVLATLTPTVETTVDPHLETLAVLLIAATLLTGAPLSVDPLADHGGIHPPVDH